MTRRSALAPAMMLAAMLALSALALLTVVPRAQAGLLSDPYPSFAPRVPLSAFASPVSWFDPSRLHLSSTVSVGSGFGGSTSTLQVTSLSYQFRAPLSMNVSIGNTFGLNRARSGASPFFLEGLDLAWRPSKNAVFRVEMHDVRSPLQYGPWGRGNRNGESYLYPY